MDGDGHVERHAGVVGLSAALKGTPFVLVCPPHSSTQLAQCQPSPTMSRDADMKCWLYDQHARISSIG